MSEICCVSVCVSLTASFIRLLLASYVRQRHCCFLSMIACLVVYFTVYIPLWCASMLCHVNSVAFLFVLLSVTRRLTIQELQELKTASSTNSLSDQFHCSVEEVTAVAKSVPVLKKMLETLTEARVNTAAQCAKLFSSCH